ncbi:uncharacterized protein LOC133185371 [Saccostrea echinata]|uniref:uncharacterized protein LOC133185371 n=1 Tax=Saccostrea echinata TaxID=191078 RepID=UPI002A7FE4AF|nr:uncharacterized protein LOC133185371 [Saccostrea echinata]
MGDTGPEASISCVPGDRTISCVAKDYLCIVDRVNSNLHKIKSELAALRQQDVKLLKQLIQISEVIQAFYQKVTKDSKSSTDISPDSGLDVSVTDVTQIRSMPLVRQQSVPYYCRINHSAGSLLSSATSSFDDISEESADDNDSLFSLSLSGHFPPRFSISLNRARSLSFESSPADPEADSYFDEVLRKNVELWKLSENVT